MKRWKLYTPICGEDDDVVIEIAGTLRGLGASLSRWAREYPELDQQLEWL